MFDQTLINEIAVIAGDHDIEPEALMAVVKVESNGKLGARINGRLEPMIRFEGHYFYRLLPTVKRNIAVVRGLASPRAGKIKNPYRQSSRWKFLKRAEAVDRCAALSSVSWGVGQVMGSHWRWLGFASIDAHVAKAREGAAGQVALTMRYISKAGLVSKLQNHDWAGFARAYNGPAYKRYKYDVKMQKAYQKFCKSRGRTNAQVYWQERNQLSILKLGSLGDAVKELQERLKAIGFALAVDGDFGPATERALKAFQRECRLKIDGIFGPRTLEMLQRRLPPAIVK